MFGLSRILTVYAVAIPLALILGYSLSTPDQMSFMMIGLTVTVLPLPIFIKWHHMLLIAAWNTVFIFPFLPGQPQVWFLLALMSFGISWLNGLLGGQKFIREPELTRPLLFLAAVVFITGYLRGGIGARAFGNASYGGRSYFYILGAIVGYFALSAVRIPVAKAGRVAELFFVSRVTGGLSNLVFMLGPAFFFLFYLLPSDFVTNQVTYESGFQPEAIDRLNGVTAACTALVYFFLVRWGLRGIFSLVRPWRIILFVTALALSLLGGFRSAVVLLGVTLICQFFFEGLWRTRFLAIFLSFGVAVMIATVLFSDRLPLAAQRAISFLPVKVDPGVKADADSSLEWRLEMWRILWPQIPKYLLLGKGYAIDPTELYFADLGSRLGQTSSSETSLVAGDYHSGPLSTIIPLGLGGAIGLLWLMGAGLKALFRNYRYGDPALRRINTFLLAFFVTQCFMFFAVFGAFNSELYLFTGILGLSVSLNSGVCKRRQVSARVAQPAVVETQVLVPA